MSVILFWVFFTKMKDKDLIFSYIFFFLNLICIERQAMLIRTVFVHV